MEINHRLYQLLEAVEEERKEEERFFLEQMREKSLRDKVKAGIAWHPIQYLASGFTVGDYIEIKIEKAPLGTQTGKLREGNGVLLQLARSGTTENLRATIASLGRSQMVLLCKAEDVDDLEMPLSAINAVELVYDEKPFLLMKEALQKVIEAEKGTLYQFKKAVYGDLPVLTFVPKELQCSHEFLNTAQKSAITNVLGSGNFSIIHGPPGTGKTTTLIGLIRELALKQKRILVCASSNHATDLLALKCMEAGLETVRIGNLSRIGEDVLKVTLDEKVRAKPEWDQIKKQRIEAEKIRRQAAKYKRSFGAEEKALRKQLFAEAKATLKYADEMEDEMVKKVLQNATVIVTTLMSSATSLLNRMTFETLIIDEASQTTEPESWIAIGKAERIILAGDPVQLPPTVKTRQALNLGLQKTLMDTLLEKEFPSHLLDTQYRMNGEVLSFPNHQFYGNLLHSGQAVVNRHLYEGAKSFQFVDTAGTGYEEIRDEESQSLYNPGEWNIIQNHIEQQLDKLAGHTVAIISPYAEQVRYIQSDLKASEINYPFSLDCDTIDGFQGQERDVVYLSLVRSNDQNEIGFLNDLRRLNVAITRARLQVVVVGDSVTLSKNTTYSQLIAHAEKSDGYQSAWEYMSW
ncbi:MAG: AAA domain-containing protein [Saprospiraceae bacterium]